MSSWAAGDADVSVAVGDFRSDADEDAAAKEAEESKRLLYVALTRARDRLYLGSVLKDGSLQPGRGSLAAVLPPTLIDRFAEPGEVVEWRASSGAVHRFRVIRRSDVELRNSNRVNVEASNPESRIPNPDVVSLEALVDSAPERVSVASIVSPDAGRFGSHRTAAASGRLAGTLVHRLLQRIGIQDPGAGTRDEQRVREMALRLVRAQEVDEHDDVQHIVDAAVEAYHSICGRDDIRVLYQTWSRAA